MNKQTPFRLLAIISLITLWSCDGDNDIASVSDGSPKTLSSSTKIFDRPVGDLTSFIEIGGLDVDKSKMIYDVGMYKINYMTDYKDASIEASAVLLVPNTEDEVSFFSFQHGTIASDAEAPTNLKFGDNQLILASSLSSMGYVVLVPDYIGFGASVEVMHPYYVEELSATVVINGLYAAKQVAEDAGKNVNAELYLGGYSQGGYVTMATHKYLEEHEMHFFNLKASFPSSGGYDVKAFQEYFFELETFHQPMFLTYVANAYKVTYDWDEPLSMFFNEPYAANIPEYFDGSYSGSQINELLNDTISVLVNSDFIENVESSDYTFVNDAFKANSLTDWTPEIPLFMYHGDADITVPFENSVLTYNQLINNGASTDVVTFTTLPGGTHASGVGPYIENFIAELIRINQ